MIGLDTNVLIRYLVQDDEAQASAAEDVIDTLTPAVPGFISIVALAEIAWVLRSVYRVPDAEILPIVEGFLSAEEIRVQHPDVVRRAVGTARLESVGFADALIGCLGELEACTTTMTFDRRAAGASTMTLIASD